MDLNEIVKRCQLGEENAFRELFKSIEKKALGTAYLISGKRGIAEDILQETYLKCFKEIKNLKNPQTFHVWFYRILVRTGWEMVKRFSEDAPQKEEFENIVLLYHHQHQFGHDLECLETRMMVNKAVNGLSDNLKSVVILYYYNDMTIDEISKTLGCFKATVKSRLYYARNALKKQIEHILDDEGFYYGKECKADG